MKRIDLHTHSTYSDGTAVPAEVVARAQKAGLEVLVLTDHDSVSGFAEAEAEAAKRGVQLHCGIEINTAQADQVHILGYGIRPRDESLLAHLTEFRERRVGRARRIVEKLRELGLDVSFEDVRAASHESLGRPHIADALRRKGLVRSREEAFSRYLMRGKPAYVEPMGPTPREAIAVIREAGGFASLAHPESVKDLPGELPGWISAGLEGLESYYGAHGPAKRERFSGLAARFGLIETGGSDFHGPGTGRNFDLGVAVPDGTCDLFMERLSRCG